MLFLLEQLATSAPTVAPELDAELAKRLRSCRSPKQTLVAAKAIAVVHRLVLAGGGASLPECGAELPGVCSAPEGDPMLRAQADAVADAADYVRQLREWPEAAALRAHGGAQQWRTRPIHLVTAGCRGCSALAQALECAGRGPSATASLQALRCAVAEDALCLFRRECAAVAVLQDNLLTLRPALVGASPGGALEMLDSFSRHAARALRSRSSRRSPPRRAAAATPPPASTACWPSGCCGRRRCRGPPRRRCRPPRRRRRPRPRPRRPARTAAATAGGADDDDDSGNTVALLARMEEERDELVLYLLKQLPEESLCALGEAEVGRPIRTAIELSDDELRRLRTDALLRATRQAAGARHHKHGAAINLRKQPTLTIAELTPRALVAGGSCGTSAGGGEASPGGTFGAQTRSPSVSLLLYPSMMSPSYTGGSAPSTPRGEMLVLPPLPVPKTELHPQLVSRMSDDALSCAAYETLYLAVLAGSAAPPVAAADALQAVRARLNLTKRQEKRCCRCSAPRSWPRASLPTSSAAPRRWRRPLTRAAAAPRGRELVAGVGDADASKTPSKTAAAASASATPGSRSSATGARQCALLATRGGRRRRAGAAAPPRQHRAPPQAPPAARRRPTRRRRARAAPTRRRRTRSSLGEGGAARGAGRAARRALAPLAVALGFRLYCALLQATFEADERRARLRPRRCSRCWRARGPRSASTRRRTARGPHGRPLPAMRGAAAAPPHPQRPRRRRGAPALPPRRRRGAAAREQQPVRRGAGGAAAPPAGRASSRTSASLSGGGGRRCSLGS